MTCDQAEAKRLAWGTDERRERAANTERESILAQKERPKERVKVEEGREGKATKQRGVVACLSSEEDGSQLRMYSNRRCCYFAWFQA